MVSNIIEKLKNAFKNRKILIITATSIAILLCCVYFFFFSTPDSKTQTSTNVVTREQEYVSELENKLESVLSKISGAGELNILITLESGFEYEYAKDEETKTTNTNGNEISQTTSSIVLVSGNPIVVKEINPKVKGVVVVSSGAKDIAVKTNIINSIITVLEVDSSKITVLY